MRVTGQNPWSNEFFGLRVHDHARIFWGPDSLRCPAAYTGHAFARQRYHRMLRRGHHRHHPCPRSFVVSWVGVGARIGVSLEV